MPRDGTIEVCDICGAYYIERSPMTMWILFCPQCVGDADAKRAWLENYVIGLEEFAGGS